MEFAGLFWTRCQRISTILYSGFYGASWGFSGIPEIRVPFLEFPKQRGTPICGVLTWE